MAAYAQGRKLNVRPHTKTHKIPAIARMQAEAGCRGITVAKVGEAEVMAAAGLDDILVAYPVLGSGRLERLAALARERRLLVALDSPVTASAISAAAARAGSEIGLLVEVDVGLRRCGVGTAAEAEALAQHIESLAAVRFAGINIYPGHVWAPPDQQGPALAEVSAMLCGVLERLHAAGFKCEVVSGGSTPTAYNSHHVAGLTEIRPGTYVFNDRNTLGLGACTVEDCALRVMVTVVSDAVPGRAIIDGGSKTFSGDRWLSGDKMGCGLLPEHPDIRFESMSEEHGHLDVSQARHKPRVGDRLSVIPNHVCTCVNMHDRVYYHRRGAIEGAWTVEGRGKVI
jgi:D-serine deaminase-like pyridoxal phosphate-dependent protein